MSISSTHRNCIIPVYNDYPIGAEKINVTKDVLLN